MVRPRGSLENKAGRSPVFLAEVQQQQPSNSEPALHTTAPRSGSAIQYRVLATRGIDEFEISLLWDPATDELAVVIRHSEWGTLFEVPVRAGQRPLEVYKHPFAYVSSAQATPSPAS